jgi:lysophospholipase L1-like esterase
MFAIGASVTVGAGATVVTGLDGFRTKPDGFVDASVIGTDGYVALDHTLVEDDLDTDAKVTAVENDRYIPLLNKDVTDPDSKMALGRLWQWVLGKIKSLPTTITAFRSGDVIPVDGPSGPAKMGKNSLLKEATTKALKELFADGESFDFAISDDEQNVLLELLQGHIKTKNFDSRQNSYYQKDGAYDFAIVDDDDNVLAEFDGGHIKTKNFDSRQNSYYQKNGVYDFAIIDDDDNVLAEFDGGHFKTKNFDSRNVALDLTGKKISILGDSISTYTGYIPTGHAAEYKGSNHGVTSVNQTWWKRLLDKTGAVLGVNESWAGSGVSGTDDGVKAISTTRLNNIGANGTPDIIIIQVGTNDVNKDFGDFEFWKLAKGETYTTTKFFPAYSYIVEKLLTMYSSRIICMSPIYRNPAGWDNLNTNNPYGNTMTQMAEGIKKIAETYHVDFIPLDACGINVNNYTTYLSDNRPAEPTYQVHPNPAGFELMFKKIYNEMKTMSFT